MSGSKTKQVTGRRTTSNNTSNASIKSNLKKHYLNNGSKSNQSLSVPLPQNSNNKKRKGKMKKKKNNDGSRSPSPLSNSNTSHNTIELKQEKVESELVIEEGEPAKDETPSVEKTESVVDVEIETAIEEQQPELPIEMEPLKEPEPEAPSPNSEPEMVVPTNIQSPHVLPTIEPAIEKQPFQINDESVDVSKLKSETRQKLEEDEDENEEETRPPPKTGNEWCCCCCTIC